MLDDFVEDACGGDDEDVNGLQSCNATLTRAT
jgi:hypothetical protein